jgi:hypothetical protein
VRGTTTLNARDEKMAHRITMRRVYAVFATDAEGNEKVLGTALTRSEGDALVEAFRRNERVAAHEAEDKNCPDGGGRVAPLGKHWVMNITSRQWVLENSGTPWTCSVASETYWSS